MLTLLEIETRITACNFTKRESTLGETDDDAISVVVVVVLCRMSHSSNILYPYAFAYLATLV